MTVRQLIKYSAALAAASVIGLELPLPDGIGKVHSGKWIRGGQESIPAATASLVVEIEDGTCEAVLGSLAVIKNVSVYGIKDNRIIVVIEGEDINAVEETVRRIYPGGRITGVHYAFTGIYASAESDGLLKKSIP
jgi:nitrate reductase NapAB chaperone NapD